MRSILTFSFVSFLLTMGLMGCMAHARIIEVRSVEIHDEKWHWEHDHDYNWKLYHHYTGPDSNVSAVVVIHDERWHYDHDHDDNWRHDHPWHVVIEQ